MKNRTSAQRRILEVSGVFHWFTQKDLVFLFTGQTKKRVKWIEYNLPRLMKEGLLKEAWYRGRKVYTSWTNKMHLEHGIICTKALVRFVAADSECEVIGENEFRAYKFGVVPEWGILYPNGTLVLFEYCSVDNAGRNGLVTKKVNLYRSSLGTIERRFKGEEEGKAVVIMLLDTKDALKHATRSLGTSFVYFVDCKTFFSVDPKDQLTAPIYIWGGDGKEYALR